MKYRIKEYNGYFEIQKKKIKKRLFKPNMEYWENALDDCIMWFDNKCFWSNRIPDLQTARKLLNSKLNPDKPKYYKL